MCFSDCGRVVSAFRLVSFFICLSIFTGCAAKTATIPRLHDDEIAKVRDRFFDLATRRQGCTGFEADATVKVTAMLQDGGLSGLLLAEEPAAVKFVGLNPFGQPVLVLASNGENFTLVSVPEGTVWSGPVTAQKIASHLPDGLALDEIYDLVTGRLPAGCRDGIKIRRDPGAAGYTLTASCPGHTHVREIAFDPESSIISSMNLIDRKYGDAVLAISYGSHENGACRLPTHIIIEESKATGFTLELRLAALDTSVKLTPADFTQKAPAGFERIDLK